MPNCEFCGAENAPNASHCAACGEPLSAEVAKADLLATEEKVQGKTLRKEVVWGGLALVLIGALLFAGIRSYRKRQLRDTVRDFYTSFRETDDAQVPQFWKCITRSEKMPKDNLELESALETAVVKSAGNYTKHARTKCMPLISAAPAKLESIVAPSFLSESYDHYLVAVRALQKDTESYLAIIDAIEKNRVRDQMVQRLGSNYHYADQESVDTWAYDHFLRCAVPDFANMKDMQQVLEYLSTTLKDPVPQVQRWRKDCYPMLEKTAGTTADPDYKKKVEAFSTDDRDVQAFQDCLKMSFDKERRASHAPFEQAWYRFAQARDGLTADIGGYLAD